MLRREFLGRVGSAIAGAMLAKAGLDYIMPRKTIVTVPAAPAMLVPTSWVVDPRCPEDRVYVNFSYTIPQGTREIVVKSAYLYSDGKRMSLRKVAEHGGADFQMMREDAKR